MCKTGRICLLKLLVYCTKQNNRFKVSCSTSKSCKITLTHKRKDCRMQVKTKRYLIIVSSRIDSKSWEKACMSTNKRLQKRKRGTSTKFDLGKRRRCWTIFKMRKTTFPVMLLHLAISPSWVDKQLTFRRSNCKSTFARAALHLTKWTSSKASRSG